MFLLILWSLIAAHTIDMQLAAPAAPPVQAAPYAAAGIRHVSVLTEPEVLDHNLRDRTADDLGAILGELDLPAIYVTHDVEEALAVADRVVRERPMQSAGGPLRSHRAPLRARLFPPARVRDLLSLPRRVAATSTPPASPAVPPPAAPRLAPPLHAPLCPGLPRRAPHKP